MAQADPAPRVGWTDWHKAKEAGIEMPEPPAELRPWRPAIADTDYWDERSAFTSVGSDALVMQADPEPPEAQALHRALGLTGFQGGSKPALRLFAPEPRFEGYPWYDTLARVTGIETLVTVDGAVRSLDYFTNDPRCEWQTDQGGSLVSAGRRGGSPAVRVSRLLSAMELERERAAQEVRPGTRRRGRAGARDDVPDVSAEPSRPADPSEGHAGHPRYAG